VGKILGFFHPRAATIALSPLSFLTPLALVATAVIPATLQARMAIELVAWTVGTLLTRTKNSRQKPDNKLKKQRFFVAAVPSTTR
jgi:hypothetical protein